MRNQRKIYNVYSQQQRNDGQCNSHQFHGIRFLREFRLVPFTPFSGNMQITIVLCALILQKLQ